MPFSPGTPEAEVGKALVQSDPGLMAKPLPHSLFLVYIQVICQKGIPGGLFHIY